MIVKTNIGKSFGVNVSYLTQDEKKYEVIHAEGVRMDKPENMVKDFNYQRKMNPNLGQAVWHSSFSFSHADKGKVTNELIKNIAEDYAKKVGLDQYAVIRHNDTKHEHFHFIGNRVNEQGKSVSDKFSASRGVEFSKAIEQKYNLDQDKEKHIEKTNFQKLSPEQKTKYEIYQAIKQELPKCSSIYDLQRNLQDKNIETNIHAQSTGRVSGISFRKNDLNFKGSEIDKNFSVNNLKQTIFKALDLSKNINPNIITKTLRKGLDMSQGMGY